GDLAAGRVQRFATYEDLRAAGVTLKAREEYEPHLAAGTVVYSGVDYQAVLDQAQAECDVLVWDGGNSDGPFYRPGPGRAGADPLRAGGGRRDHPGGVSF